MKTQVAWTLIAAHLLTTSVMGANPSASSISASTRMGIIRMNDLHGELGKYYPLLERRLQRWLENISGSRIKAERLSGSLSQADLKQSNYYLELLKYESELARGTFTTESRSNISAFAQKVAKVSNSLKLSYWANPLLQRVYLRLAQVQFKTGDLKAAKASVAQSSFFHPAGEVSAIDQWEASGAMGSQESFSLFAQAALADSRRTCAVTIKVPTNGMRVFANGFPIPLQTNFVNSQLVRIWGELNGRRTDESLVRCSGTTAQVIALSWPAAGVQESVLLRAGEGGAFQSYLIVGGTKLDFRMFLFTPKKGMDEIPLEQPLTVRYLSDAGLDESLPVSKLTLGGILEKHHLVASTEPTVVSGDRFFPQSESHEEGVATNGWYRSKTFWGVLGGVLVGGAVILLMNRSGDSVGSQGQPAELKGSVH